MQKNCFCYYSCSPVLMNRMLWQLPVWRIEQVFLIVALSPRLVVFYLCYRPYTARVTNCLTVYPPKKQANSCSRSTGNQASSRNLKGPLHSVRTSASITFPVRERWRKRRIPRPTSRYHAANPARIFPWHPEHSYCWRIARNMDEKHLSGRKKRR